MFEFIVLFVEFVQYLTVWHNMIQIDFGTSLLTILCAVYMLLWLISSTISLVDVIWLNVLFFQQLCYLMYDIHTQVAPINLINQFTKTRTMHNYNMRSSSNECFTVKTSRTEKMKKSFTRIGVSMWNSIPLSLK